MAAHNKFDKIPLPFWGRSSDGWIPSSVFWADADLERQSCLVWDLNRNANATNRSAAECLAEFNESAVSTAQVGGCCHKTTEITNFICEAYTCHDQMYL